MRGDTSMSAKRERGFLAESRFIYLANVPPDPRCRPPRGYVRLEQAPPIMDVRGIDGFVVHYRLSTTTAPRRIPIQLKNGGEPWVASASTHCGMEIPILHTSTDITQFNVLDRIRSSSIITSCISASTTKFVFRPLSAIHRLPVNSRSST